MASPPVGVGIEQIGVDGDLVRYRLTFDLGQMLGLPLCREAAGPGLRHGDTLTARPPLPPIESFTCERVWGHGGINHWGRSASGAELTWLIKEPGPILDAARLEHQREWSLETFGPGARTAGVLAHIRKELEEIEQDPADLEEWIDVILLALDGAWRVGYPAHAVLTMLLRKQAANETRVWPDWRTADPEGPIEHVRPAIRTVDGIIEILTAAAHPANCPDNHEPFVTLAQVRAVLEGVPIEWHSHRE